MANEAKKILLAGVGAAALTYEKANEVVSQWVQRGKLTVEDGKELTEELKRNVTEKNEEKKEAILEKVENLRPLTKEALKDVLTEMNYATKADVIELKRKVEILEEKIKQMEEKEI